MRILPRPCAATAALLLNVITALLGGGTTSASAQTSASDEPRVIAAGRTSEALWHDVQDVRLEDVDRIEVLRAGDTLWGAGATNATIHVITKAASATAGGLIFDRSPHPSATFTVQGEAGRGHVDIAESPNIFVNAAHVLARFRSTSTSGAELQVQTSYEHTSRNVPDYTDRRNTTNGDLTYRFRASARHTVIVEGYAAVSGDRTISGITKACSRTRSGGRATPA